MLAVAVAACLAPLALLDELGGWRRFAGALLRRLRLPGRGVPRPGRVQGDDAGAVRARLRDRAGWPRATLAAREARGAAAAARGAAGRARGRQRLRLQLPGPALARRRGSRVWAAIELARAARRGGLGAALAARRGGADRARRASACSSPRSLPSSGGWSTSPASRPSTPTGAGLGNLFDRLSPLEALGIWPSGDFRVEPGDGAVPGARLLPRRRARARRRSASGSRWWWRRGERARAGGARGRGAALALLAGRRDAVPGGEGARARGAAGRADLGPGAGRARAGAGRGRLPRRGRRLERARARQRAGRAERLLAGAGRAARRELGAGSVVVLAPAELLDDQHGRDYLVWELRGNRICVEERRRRRRPRPGGRSRRSRSRSTTTARSSPSGGPRARAAGGPGPCPLIPDGARADPSAGG